MLRLLRNWIVLAAVPEREDPRDAFISHIAKKLQDLPQGAVVGTASLRRQAQALHLRPDLKIVMLRGSVQTRLKKLEDGNTDYLLALRLAVLNKQFGRDQDAARCLEEAAKAVAAGQGGRGGQPQQ